MAERDRLEKKEFQTELDSKVKQLVAAYEAPQVEALNNLYAIAANLPDTKTRTLVMQRAVAAKQKFDSDQMRMYREMVAMDKMIFELQEAEESANAIMEADLAAAKARCRHAQLQLEEDEERRYKTEERLQREGKMEVQRDMNKLLESRRKDFLAKQARFDQLEAELATEEQAIRALSAKVERRRLYGEKMAHLCHDQWDLEEGARRPEDRVGYVFPTRPTFTEMYVAFEDGCQALALRFCSTGVFLVSRCFLMSAQSLQWCFCGGENDELFA